jgi:hypothetical protein
MKCSPLVRSASLLALMLSAFTSTACSDDDARNAGRCSVFEPCGGDIEGTWAIATSCVEGNLTGVANLNRDLPIQCRGMYQDVQGTLSGSVGFSAGTANVDTLLSVDYDISAPDVCVAAGLGTNVSSPPTDSDCEAFGKALVALPLHSSVTCSPSESRCHCKAKDEVVKRQTRTYSVSGSKITYSDSTDTLDFCVKGSNLRGRQFDKQLVSTVFIVADRKP